MIKHPKKRFEKFLNVAHRYFVFTSIAFTLVSTGWLGVVYYNHRQARKLHLAELRTKELETVAAEAALVDKEELKP